MKKTICTFIIAVMTLWCLSAVAQTVTKGPLTFTKTTYNGREVFQLTSTTSAANNQQLEVPGWVAYNNVMYPTTIGQNALVNLTNLQRLIVKWGCLYIHPVNLSGCTAMREIFLPSSYKMEHVFFGQAGNSSTQLDVYYACLTPTQLASYPTTYKSKSRRLLLPTQRAVNCAKAAATVNAVFNGQIYVNAAYANDYSDQNNNCYVITQYATANAYGKSTLVYAPYPDVVVYPYSTLMDDFCQDMDNGYRCSEVPDSMFMNKSITSFKWENAPSGSRIGEYAFYHCTSLNTVNINAETIEWGAFNGCTNLSNLTLNEGVGEVSYYSFANCTSLTTVNFPATMSNLGTHAFVGCSSLGTFKVAAGNANYNDYRDCLYSNNSKWLVSVPQAKMSFTASPTMVRVMSYAFEQSDMFHVVLPYGLTRIDSDAFAYSRITRLHIPGTLSTLAQNAFRNMQALKQLSVNVATPPSITSSEQFYCQNGLTPTTTIAIYTPYGKETDYQNAGWTSTSTRTLAINPGHNTAYDFECNYSASMSSVQPYLDCTVISTEPVEFEGTTYDGEVRMESGYVPNGTNSAFQAYYTHYLQRSNPIKIPKNVSYNGKNYLVTQIGQNTFAYLGGDLTTALGQTVLLPTSVNYLFSQSFMESCVTDIDMPGVEIIGRKAFYNSRVKTIRNWHKLTTINEEAFAECKDLTRVILPYGITQLWEYVFKNSGVETLLVPSSMASISSYSAHSLSGMTSLKNLYLNTNRYVMGLSIDVGEKLFVPDSLLYSYRLSYLADVFGANNIYNGSYDFACSNDPYLHYTVTSDDAVVWNGQNYAGTVKVVRNADASAAPTSIEVVSSAPNDGFGSSNVYLVTKLDRVCFDGLANVNHVTIPASVNNIGNYAMRKMTGLQTLQCDAPTPPALGSSVWSDVDQSRITLTVPNGTAALYQSKAQWREFYIEGGYALGDVDGDSSVDVSDVNIVINIMLGKTNASDYPGSADCDNDGSVDVSDVNIIINIMLGKL